MPSVGYVRHIPTSNTTETHRALCRLRVRLGIYRHRHRSAHLREAEENDAKADVPVEMSANRSNRLVETRRTFSCRRIKRRDPASLPEDLRRAIVGIKPVEVGNGLQYECRFADKQKALDSLARHLQMFKDMVIVENVFRIVNEMDVDELDRRLSELERAIGKATTLDPAAGEGPARIH